MPNKNYARLTVTLCLIAAVLYNSWPLGYVLDSSTARYGLASDLELVGHPYYWLFIWGDVLTAACVVVVAAIVGFKFLPLTRSKALTALAAGLVLFGVFTAISALLPSQCALTTALRCGADHGHGIGLDALTSTVAAVGLFVSMASLSFKSNRDRPRALLTRLNEVTFAAWSFSAIFFIKLALANQNAHVAQYALLLLSGLAVALMGFSTVII